VPNLASVLKEEIRRLARKESKAQVRAARRAAAAHRRDIAALKRQVQGLKKQVAFLESQEKKRVSKPTLEAPSGRIRFSAHWLKAHRMRLGISAADYGKLLGVSALTVYNWENGKSKPRKEGIAALAAIRGLRRREALTRLEMLGA
jgi:DNA-binding transcriptional regulator YiaG